MRQKLLKSQKMYFYFCILCHTAVSMEYGSGSVAQELVAILRSEVKDNEELEESEAMWSFGRVIK